MRANDKTAILRVVKTVIATHFFTHHAGTLTNGTQNTAARADEQVVASLLVSVLALGFKLNELPLIVQMNQRRNELKANLILLQRQLELEDLVIWLDQTALDTAHRQEWIAAMESA